MLNNWNTRMIQGLYPFHEISADILRDSWKKSATACQYRSRCPLDEGFNSDSDTTDEEALLGEMNNYRAIFWYVLLGLHNAFGEYIFMDLLWIIHFEKIIKKRNFNFKNFDNLQMFKILNDFWCTCVVVVFCFYGVYSII